MSLGEFIAVMTVFVIPAIVIMYIANRFFRLRERKLGEMEQRLRVVEQIVTDTGVHTAAQIETLRRPPQIHGDQERAAATKDSSTSRP